MDAITVAGLRKWYGSTDALRGVDLTVPQGEIVALLGPNGAGKTTLVEILEGHRVRSGGAVSVLGLDPGDRRDFAELRTRIGVVTQDTMLEPGVSGLDLLRRQASYYAAPTDVDVLLEKVGLTEKRRSIVRSLSGGMRRRLDIALALVGRPHVLFLDEPSAGLDPVSRREIRRLVHEVKEQGTTVLLTSHDLDEVQDLADAVHVLDAGRVVARGTSDQIIRGSAAPTRIEFRRPEGVDVGSLPPGAVLDGSRVRYETAEHDLISRDLRRWSQESGADLDDLAIIPPTLDDAYVSLLGGTTTTGAAQ